MFNYNSSHFQQTRQIDNLSHVESIGSINHAAFTESFADSRFQINVHFIVELAMMIGSALVVRLANFQCRISNVVWSSVDSSISAIRPMRCGKLEDRNLCAINCARMRCECVDRLLTQ